VNRQPHTVAVPRACGAAKRTAGTGPIENGPAGKRIMST
jgi:hypothetical protein